MPRYFFDIHDGVQERDEVGVICADVQVAAREADRLLPTLMEDREPNVSARQIIMVVMGDMGVPVYQAALSHVGTWLTR